MESPPGSTDCRGCLVSSGATPVQPSFEASTNGRLRNADRPGMRYNFRSGLHLVGCETEEMLLARITFVDKSVARIMTGRFLRLQH